MEKLYTIPEDTLNKVLNLIGQLPLAQVLPLYQEIQQVVRPVEVKDAPDK